MRLTVPEPQITLYEDGFDEHDQLGRKETGDKLSDLVERIDDPLVIALDGAWGSGKSFFLKCWVGEHKNHNAQTKTVYFDAFKHDFLDDPLIALTGAIAERFEMTGDEDEAPSADRSKKIKKAAWAVGRGALRIGASVATFGATEVLSDMGDAVAEAVGNEAKTLINSTVGEKEATDFWNAHDARIAAMEAFRIALTELTEPYAENEPTRKLVMVVDELDRCRPDYALSLLEIIKHFFNVPGVHFVLGVNLKELQNSVRARYGGNADAGKYLSKLYHVRMPLTLEWNVREQSGKGVKYFEYVRDAIELKDTHYAYELVRYVKLCNLSGGISLRDIERIATKAAITPIIRNQQNTRDYHLVSGLIVISQVRPDWIDQISSGKLTFQELETMFPLRSIDYRSSHTDDLLQLWQWALGEVPQEDLDGNEIFLDRRFPPNPVGHISSLVTNYIDAFRLT